MKTKKSGHMTAASLLGGIGAFLIAIIISFVLSLLSANSVLNPQILNSSIPFIIVISTSVGALISASLTDKKYATITILGAASVYCILCMILKAIFFQGNFQFFVRNTLLILGAAGAAMIIHKTAWGSKRKHIKTRRR